MVQASELLPGGHSIAPIIFLRARLTARIDGHGRTRRRRRLDAMLHAAKDVGDIPMRGPGLAGHVLATLDVPRFHLLSAFATDARAERRIPSGAKHDAAPAEAAVLASFPAIAQDDDRGGAVVEAEALEVADRALDLEGAASEVGVLVEDDLCGRLRGDGRRGHCQNGPQCRIHRCLTLWRKGESI